jgi:hypothetical protein
MKRLLTARGTPAAVVAALMLLAGGGGYAIASSSNTFNACVSKKSHVLYTGKCKKGDKKVSWNEQGPQGIQGVQGKQGIEGIQGPAGPTAGLSAYNNTSSLDVGTAESYTTLVSLTLPAGSYILIGKTTIENTSGAVTTCYIVPPGGTAPSGAIDLAFATQSADTSDTEESLVAPLTTSGGTATLQCVSTVSGTTAHFPHLAAIQVGSVSGS